MRGMATEKENKDVCRYAYFLHTSLMNIIKLWKEAWKRGGEERNGRK